MQAGPRLNLGAPHHGAAVGGSFLWFRQLHVLLWKNIYVKRMRRHYLTTLLEIVLIVALLLGIQDDAVVREPLVRHGSTIYSPASPADLWSALPDMANITRVYFAPSTSYLSWLTRTAFFELGVIEVVELNNQKELATVAMQLANETLPARAIALHYSFPANDDPERPASLHVSFYASRLPFDIQCRYAQRLISQPEGPTTEEFFPEVNTLLPAVAWLQQRHLQFHAQRCNCTLEPIRLRRFPYPPHIEHKDTKNYAFVLTRFCIGVLVPFAVTVARLTEERASGMKEMLRVVGVSDWVYWLSHYLSGFFMHVIIVTLMMLFASVKRNPEGRAFIQFSDPSLLFVILMCFCSSCQLHAILLSTLFASPHSAVAGAMLYWTITCVLPFLTLEHANGQGYHYIERKYKIWSSIFPGINLHWSFRVLERFEKFVDRGANWANFMDHAGTPDNVTLAEIVFVGILADSVIVLLLWYLDNVLPNGPGIPKPLLYPFKLSYWIPTVKESHPPSRTPQEMPNFEPEPRDQLVAIDIAHASKDYDGVVAVHDVSMRIFQHQITVLLGHNGAGKTTLLSLITGFLNCSSGVVAIGGYDVKTSTRDARYSIGYCPQTNILFDDLTVEEHVMFFGIVKGIPMNIVRTEVVTLLHDVGLSSLRSVLPVDLSLGQQRRLSTALAIIGTPKVIIMDEPTTHMDPESRRDMWELLLKIRRSCAILLTTQHLDEADVLGDRVAIMANGRMRVIGSPTFLKHQFDTGYHLLINKRPPCNIAAIEKLLRKYSPKAHRSSESDTEAIFLLGHIVSTQKIVTMFKDLEQQSGELGIASLGVTVTSLEDVLVRIGEVHHAHHVVAPMSPGDVPSEVTPLEVMGSAVKVVAAQPTAEATRFGRFRAIISKRVIYICRQKKIPLFSWLLPPLLLFLLFSLEYVALRGTGRVVERTGDSLPFNFPEVVVFAQGFLQADKDEQFLNERLKPMFTANEFSVETVEPDVDVILYLLQIAKSSLRRYVFSTHFGVQVTSKTGTVLWYNGDIQHTAALVTTLYNNARLRNVTKNANAEFSFEVTSEGIKRAREAPEGEVKEDTVEEGIRSQNTYRELLPKVLRSVFFPLVSSLVCGNFVLFPIAERALQVKHLHMITGVSPLLYWLANFAFDFMVYMGTALSVIPPLVLFLDDILMTSDVVLILVLNMLHGYAALPVIYIFSFIFRSPGSGFTTLTLSAFFLSSAGCLAAVFVEYTDRTFLSTVVEVALHVARLLPSYSYSRGMTKILQLAREATICQSGHRSLESQCHTFSAKHMQSLEQCCLHLSSSDPAQYAIEPLDVHPYSAFYEVLALSIEGAVLFAVVLLIERWIPVMDLSLSEPTMVPPEIASAVPPPHHSLSRGISGMTKTGGHHEDTDVKLEDELVARLPADPLQSPSVMSPFVIVRRLYRAYGYLETKQVLQGLSFTVRSGECFGLLGVNGAGKTTTFRILTGQILPHGGDAYVAGFSVVNNRPQVHHYMGYCPQRDGLLDMMTGIETLVLYGRLRGVPMTREYLDVLIDIFRLEDIADQLVGTYSAGSRRKLSLCVSIIGLPKLLLLDEPYTSIGVTARQSIVRYISAVQRASKIAILLSSHSLSDVEFQCNRIAILGGGRLQCLGSLAHLKEKFGQGYTITVKAYPDKKQDTYYLREVAQAVASQFPKAELVYHYEGLLEFRMSRVRLLWSEMFSRMARIKKRFKLQDFFITDTSLAQIFLSVTRKEASEAAVAAVSAHADAPHAVVPA